jgi:hypothetical protein
MSAEYVVIRREPKPTGKFSDTVALAKISDLAEAERRALECMQFPLKPAHVVYFAVALNDWYHDMPTPIEARR